MRTSPARPAADSRLVNATVEIVSANSVSFHVGDVPRSIDFVSASMSTTSSAPSRMISACSAMSARASAETRSMPRPPPTPPRMLRAAT